MRTVCVRLACIAVALTGCLDVDDRQITDPPVAPQLSPSVQWAGGTVRLTAEIEAGDPAPRLSLAGEDLEVVAGGEGWSEYRLPTDARGDIALVLEGSAASFDVRVLGFRWVQPLGREIFGNLLVWPRHGGASFLALDENTEAVVRIIPASLRADVVLDLPGSGLDARGVAPTAVASRILVPQGGIWRLLPTPELGDSIDFSFGRHAMLLSDSILVFSGHHTISAVDPRAGGPYLYTELHEETRGMVVSPSGRYGAVRVNGSNLGPPVFSAQRGEALFHIDTLSHSDGVDFSPVGDTLYIAGLRRAEPREHLILAIDATNGAVLDGLEIAGYNPLNVVRDLNTPWLYVMTALPEEPPMLLVVDTRTMEIAGRIETSGYAGCLGSCEGAVAVGPEGVFFVTSGGPSSAPGVVFAFDGWPVN